jgi:hypothetical protein
VIISTAVSPPRHNSRQIRGLDSDTFSPDQRLARKYGDVESNVERSSSANSTQGEDGPESLSDYAFMMELDETLECLV